MADEYGYLSFSSSYYSNTSIYGNEITVNENLYVSGMRILVNKELTGTLRIGTISSIIKESQSTNFSNGWNEVLFDDIVELTPGVTYILQGTTNNGGIAYTQFTSNVSINTKINNSGVSHYGSFPGTSENGVWVGVDIIFSTTPPTPPDPPTPPGPESGFTIELMNNRDELNKISKSPILVRSLSGFLRDEADIVDPEILIEYNGTLVDCNYMHIEVLKRYYFITKIESVRTGLWRITAHCDVLKTYSEAILGTECVVARSESRYNLYLNDSMFKVYSNPRLQCANFPGKFTGESYVLVMNGANYT